MRITTFLMFVATLQVAAKTHSQTVTLKVKDVPLKEVFKSIQEQTGYDVLVKEELLDKLRPVTLDVKEVPLQKVMELCLINQPLDFYY